MLSRLAAGSCAVGNRRGCKHASQPTSPLQVFVGGHPTPNEAESCRRQGALELLRGCSADTLVIVLLSGGGSALFEHPLIDSVSLEELQQLNHVLVNCGASISEINTIRNIFPR